MTFNSTEALGRAVRQLRKERRLTQAQLGERAGYKGGAGVSISRLESGLVEPSAGRLAAIARVLNVDVEELLARSASEESAVRTAIEEESVEARAALIMREAERRERILGGLNEVNAASDRAKEAFLLRFYGAVGQLGNVPAAEATSDQETNTSLEGDVLSEATYQLKFTTSGVAQALVGIAKQTAPDAVPTPATYEAFIEAVSRGVIASTSARIAGLSGGSTAPLGGFIAALSVGSSSRRASGGTALAAGALAVSLAAAIGGIVAFSRRSRKQQEELAVKLAEAEAEFALTQLGFDALEELIPRALEIYNYIAVHAGHALGKWVAHASLGENGPRTLSHSERQRYRDFVEISAAELSLGTLDFKILMAAEAGEVSHMRSRFDEVLVQSWRIVSSLV